MCFSTIVLVVARGETGSRDSRKEALEIAQERSQADSE